METMSSVMSGWGSVSHGFTLEVFKRPWGHKTQPPREPTNAEYWRHCSTMMRRSFRSNCSYKQRNVGGKNKETQRACLI